MKKGGDKDESGVITCCVCCLSFFLLFVFSFYVHSINDVFNAAAFIIVVILIIVIFSKFQAYTKEEKKKEFERLQEGKGLIKFTSSKGDEYWGTPHQVKIWKEIDIGLHSNFTNLDPYQFEEFIAKLFIKMGYTAVKTKSTGDFGADVIATKDDQTILIEVKRYKEGNNVTPKEVQRALGAMWKHKANKAVFITTSDFTVRAQELENEAPIELWNKRILHELVRKYFIEEDK